MISRAAAARLTCTLALALAAPAARAAEPPAPGRVYVLMINGGGDADDNFRSHVRHLEELSQLLLAGGVPADHISVLASDGDDPGADVAIRQPDPDNFWLLEGTPAERWLAEPVAHESTRLPNLPLQPATRLAVMRWFADARERLHRGDTLFLYVTDHGSDNPRDPLDNRITLWGDHEALSVRALRAELEHLPRGVRVVTVMSQCFSGGFAALADANSRAGLPTGAVCGSFASTADRPAFGCYPEAAREDRLGHSFALFDALSGSGRLDEAHDETLVRDQSPDVPLVTSDAFAAERLRRAATAARTPERAFADRWLGEARKANPPRAEVRLAERVAGAFGLPPPRTLDAVERALTDLEAVATGLEQQRKIWDRALGDMLLANYDGFLAAQPAWTRRLRREPLRRLTNDGRRALVRELLPALEAFARGRAGDYQRLETLLGKSNDSGAAAHRMDVRQAALLRVRILLTTAAARAWLGRHGSGRERAALEALRSCEAFRLPVGPGKAPPEPPAYPALAADRELAQALAPAWLGIGFTSAAPALRTRLHLADGAATVTDIAPRSPAAHAGLRRGDIVLGEPGKPFDLRNELRAWATLAPRGRPLSLEILRGGRHHVLPITPAVQPAR
jgi:hypothetical protein